MLAGKCYRSSHLTLRKEANNYGPKLIHFTKCQTIPSKKYWSPVDYYLLKSATLLLLFLDAFLSVMQQLPLVFLRVPALSCQLGLLPLVSLGALFVLLL